MIPGSEPARRDWRQESAHGWRHRRSACAGSVAV